MSKPKNTERKLPMESETQPEAEFSQKSHKKGKRSTTEEESLNEVAIKKRKIKKEKKDLESILKNKSAIEKMRLLNRILKEMVEIYVK